MTATLNAWRRPVAAALFLLSFPFLDTLDTANAAPKPTSYWQVDDVRAGMKGQGRTVMKGTKIETFEAEVLGVLKNTSPGRDMVLCRLSGLNLDKTGVIAGMSGSPVYIDGKLLGAVAYAWPFGKEPIAGVTPFCQMQSYVASYERRDIAETLSPRRVGLRTPLKVGGTAFDAVTVSQDYDAAHAAGSDGLWMMPLRTPLVATGFTEHSLKLLQTRSGQAGWLPMQGGAASAKVVESAKDVPLQPGGPMAVSLVRGDFDLSGIGTVTHIEGNRVYGFGHPFFSIGTCDFPLMTGFIHTIYPRQSVSFKMGSPVRDVGIINADVSTCVAGWLGRKADLLPVHMTITRGMEEKAKSFQVEIVRQRTLQSTLVYTALTNSVDMEGDLPEEMTAELKARIEVEGREPIVIEDTFSGASYSGGRAPQALYNQVASLVGLLTYNTYKPIRINRIDCETRILPGRRTADIEAVELDSEIVAPGGTLKAIALLRPYKGLRQRVPISLKIPSDLPEGTYTATVCDDLHRARQYARDNPQLANPQSMDGVFAAIKVQTDVKRDNLVLRVPTHAAGVVVDGKPLPDLPPSMVQILGSSRRTGAQAMGGALVAHVATDWVLQGNESIRFTVAKNRKVLERE